MIIKQARIDRGWTQRDLVERLVECGVVVAIGSMGYIERKGTTDPNIAEGLSWVLEMKVEVLAPLEDRKAKERQRRAIRDAIKLLKAAGYTVSLEVPS